MTVLDDPQHSAPPVAPGHGADRPVGAAPSHTNGTATTERSASRSWTVVAVLCGLMLAAGILVIRGWRPGGESSGAATPGAVPSSAEIEATYGVRVVGVDVTAAGGMIQIRYQVLDPDKVDAIHDTSVSPIVVGGDGTLYDAPGMAGHSHLGRVGGAGSTNTILLANSRGGVHPGDQVTVRIGELELHHVPVG